MIATLLNYPGDAFKVAVLAAVLIWFTARAICLHLHRRDNR